MSGPDFPEELHTGRIPAWLVGLAGRMCPVHNSPEKSFVDSLSHRLCRLRSVRGFAPQLDAVALAQSQLEILLATASSVMSTSWSRCRSLRCTQTRSVWPLLWSRSPARACPRPSDCTRSSPSAQRRTKYPCHSSIAGRPSSVGNLASRAQRIGCLHPNER